MKKENSSEAEKITSLGKGDGRAACCRNVYPSEKENGKLRKVILKENKNDTYSPSLSHPQTFFSDSFIEFFRKKKFFSGKQDLYFPTQFWKWSGNFQIPFSQKKIFFWENRTLIFPLSFGNGLGISRFPFLKKNFFWGKRDLDFSTQFWKWSGNFQIPFS